MRKLFSFFAAMLFAVAANAQTDFSTPYYCAADDAVLTGGSSSNFYLDQTADPHHIAWSDVSLSSNAKATWTINATRGCYVSVSLDLGPVIASNKHNFEIRIYDSNNNLKGMVTEGGENTASMQVKEIDGTILIPLAGAYTVEVYNNRDWGKGTINNVILTYAADAPSEIIDVTAVELNKTELSLELEEVELLVATVSPEDATDPTVTWESSDTGIATVSETGLITAIAEGNAIITANAGEQTATCAVTVSARTIPSVDFNEPYALTGKIAHLEGAIWKNDDLKLYGDGDHNKNYGNALWTINVTRACIVTATLNGVEGGHLFELDLLDADEEVVSTILQPEGKTWSAGEINMDGTITFATQGNYTIRLRNTQEWSSGKVAGVTLTYSADVQPTIENGYYLVGTMNDWQAKAEYKLLLNEAADDTEYMYDITFAENDAFKVVEVVDGNWTWHPGEGTGNYVIDADHVGDATVYFRPNGKQDDPAWYYTVIYVAMKEPTALTRTTAETTAVKIINDGMLVIEKAGVKYNVMGQIVR